MDGDGETAVSKGEVTRNATLDERWSMGATRGRGGARATLMPKHRGESGWRCLSLSGRKGEKVWGGLVGCVLEREGGWPTTRRDGGGGGSRASRGGALGGSLVQCRVGSAWRA
jgi:hypothetical protein